MFTRVNFIFFSGSNSDQKYMTYIPQNDIWQLESTSNRLPDLCFHGINKHVVNIVKQLQFVKFRHQNYLDKLRKISRFG